MIGAAGPARRVAAPLPSTVHLPPGDWATVLDALCARFPSIARERWIDRFARARVLGPDGMPIPADHPHRAGLCVRYFREVESEAPIPHRERIVHADADLVVVDKPHFLPVTPSGGFVRETLLARLMQRFDNPDLVPLHRLDRATAGLVLFSARRDTRDAYQALFRERRIDKHYEALAPALPQRTFPLWRRTRLVPGEPFFRIREIDGEPNSETHVGVLRRDGAHWLYALAPRSGRKHQLRVHMAALGAPILNDEWYPDLREPMPDDPARPLKLLARSLAFVDPLDGRERRFASTRSL